MGIRIEKLTPGLAEDYVRFFDETPHNHGEENKCYCITWRSDDSYSEDGNHWYATREERRNHAVEYVKNGGLQGYLAYQGDRIVGWCNVNANCQGCLEYLGCYWPVEPRDGLKIQSVFCFLIAPDVQRTGVAEKLLRRVCRDAEAEGFDFVESYVYLNPETSAQDCRGPVSLYEKCGFVIHAQREGCAVVRKKLTAK